MKYSSNGSPMQITSSSRTGCRAGKAIMARLRFSTAYNAHGRVLSHQKRVSADIDALLFAQG